jgi:DNA adenine methylase
LPVLRSPIYWFGGKGRMQAKLLPLLPAHREYIEPYFGGGSVFFAKAPALVETINDLDSAVMGFFRVLRDRPEEFLWLAQLTPYSRELYNECRDTWQTETDPVRRAWRWWVVARQSFSGEFACSWSSVVTRTRRGMAGAPSRFLSMVDRLPEVVTRLQRTQIENAPALRVLERYTTPTSLAYLDPPYVSSTRRGGGYSCEMTDTDHAELVEALLRLPGRFVLSGYAHTLYAPLEQAGWTRVDFDAACAAAGRTRATGLQGAGSALAKQPRTESVWLDPATAAEVLTPQTIAGIERKRGTVAVNAPAECRLLLE